MEMAASPADPAFFEPCFGMGGGIEAGTLQAYDPKCASSLVSERALAVAEKEELRPADLLSLQSLRLTSMLPYRPPPFHGLCTLGICGVRPLRYLPEARAGVPTIQVLSKPCCYIPECHNVPWGQLAIRPKGPDLQTFCM